MKILECAKAHSFFCDEENAVTNGSYGAIWENMI